MNQRQHKYKVALLVNQLTPYRLPIYQALGSCFDFAIFHGGKEANRTSWQNLENKLSGVEVKRSWGLQLSLLKGKKGNTYDYKYIHINPGYLFDLLSYRPDAVITVEMGFRTLVALLYGTIFRKPVWVWSGVTLQSEQSVNLTRKILRRLISRWAKHWISYGEAATEYLLSLEIGRKHILQIQNCVDEQMFLQPTEPAVTLAPKPVLLYVGQLIGRKGANKFLETAAILQKEGHDFSLLLVGSGAEKNSLEALAQELGLRHVCFYPPQPPEDMPGIYKSADYLVFPTLEDIWGLVVNEALWSGVPVLSSIYAGCAKEILPPENCFDPLNLGNFTKTLKKALDNKILPSDTSSMKKHTEVSQAIIDDIKKTIEL